jgi:hypothetical protein
MPMPVSVRVCVCVCVCVCRGGGITPGVRTCVVRATVTLQYLGACKDAVLLYNGYRVFPAGKERPGRDADPSPSSSAVVMKE